MRISEILTEKGNKVVTMRPDETIEILAHKLRQEEIGAIVVSADGKSLDGIISERDVMRGLTRHGGTILQLKVAQLMTTTVITCGPDDTLKTAMQLMTQRRMRHLPVVDGDRIVGIISIGDVVRRRLDEMELEANVMRDVAIANR